MARKVNSSKNNEYLKLSQRYVFKYKVFLRSNPFFSSVCSKCSCSVITKQDINQWQTVNALYIHVCVCVCVFKHTHLSVCIEEFSNKILSLLFSFLNRNLKQRENLPNYSFRKNARSFQLNLLLTLFNFRLLPTRPAVR